MRVTEADINRREIYRYLGYQGHMPDEHICNIIEEVLSELLKVIQPKNLYRTYHCDIQEEKIKLWDCNSQTEAKEADFVIKSRNLADNLKSCDYTVVMAATLGIEAEKLLHRYEIVNMAKAAIAQACGAACIEAYCNCLQEEIRQEAEKKGMYLRPRFSPGYGDLPLETQRLIFEHLECTKRLGLTLTENLLMYPTKSVTAFIGLTTDRKNCHINKCKQCENTECEFRNED